MNIYYNYIATVNFHQEQKFSLERRVNVSTYLSYRVQLTYSKALYTIDLNNIYQPGQEWSNPWIFISA